MVYELIDKYYSHNPSLRDLLILHSEQVCKRALAIVDTHPDWIRSGMVDRQFVEEAAMLHDIGIVYCNAPRIFCEGEHAYIEHGFLGAELLRKEGLHKHALVAERHTGSGISLEQVMREELPIPEKDYCPQSLEEKIICYADKFFSKTHPERENTLQHIRQTIWHYGHDAILRWEEMERLIKTTV